MAQWDITAPAGSGVGGSGTGNSAITPPGDFDGATINSVVVVGTPTVTSDGTTDDTIGIRWYVRTTTPTDTYGTTSSDAASLCYASLGDSVSSANITAGSSPSPAPTTAVAADWDEIAYAANYSASMKNDGETVSWSAFTIRVDYTPNADVEIDANTASVSLTAQTATVTHPVNISGSTASISLTGQTATVSNDINVSASTASVSLTGETATLSHPVNITASTASVSLTSLTATVTHDVNITASTATVALTGQTATVDLTQNIAGNVASIALTGQTATVEFTESALSIRQRGLGFGRKRSDEEELTLLAIEAFFNEVIK